MNKSGSVIMKQGISMHMTEIIDFSRCWLTGTRIFRSNPGIIMLLAVMMVTLAAALMITTIMATASIALAFITTASIAMAIVASATSALVPAALV